MALDMKAPVPPVADPPPPAAAPVTQAEKASLPDDSVLLSLAIYTHYTWGQQTYEKGKAYRFNRETAYSLLQEMDCGRPIWTIHRPARPKQAPKSQIVDATEVRATRTRQSLEDAALIDPSRTDSGAKRIDVGTDDEIEDILNRPDTESDGNITV